MILYLDSSSIVSLYLDEGDRTRVVGRAAQEADSLCCSSVAYAEVRAALARARRESRLTQVAYGQAVGDFQREWQSYVRVEVSEGLILLAGDLAERHALRGYDAVQLASALVLRDRVPEPLSLSTWDDELRLCGVRRRLMDSSPGLRLMEQLPHGRQS